MRRAFPLVAGLLTIALAAGCSDATGGTAVPNGGGGDTPSSAGPDPSSGGPEPTVEIPPRPKDLKVDGLEPCSVLTEAQVAQIAKDYKFDAPPVQDTAGKDKICTLEQTAEPFNAIDVLLITDRGIEYWLSGQGNVDAWPVTVAEFPAVDYKLAGVDDEECVTSVGVADGQQLTVEYTVLTEEVDYRELCQVTEKIAAMATETLQTLR
ncbi:hypothetical protein BLA60_20150 [Actinophytocola xinjiangensis]|uniref:DUF3558 domain-containing protein n=1 Tax=Actinophytocola xinjiangensis TaxID=485602 RepID=A0A7Z0WLG7_9PSEU|nr:DUF3558 domain-containing protein [Actinophytocola xinjiangensis]OLF09470.1 hypothetical protein BLA60_20150 [Actinophytocola xinjiangensis]